MLISGSLFISTITKIEIVSVLGKYARGSSGGFQRCTRCISEAGESCQNQWYTAPRVRWYRREIGGWQKLIQETVSGTSSLIKVSILPFDDRTIQTAEQLIIHALVHSFASMDAMIAATAWEAIADGRDMTVVTFDKGLKACLTKVGIAYWDPFQGGVAAVS
ncbi:MAG: type II toxin-antitoxin system VapC family toxin [Lachnospiraceae bacterium]|nr:type II toxin-antitoxin system VapC family toxin [Lachnospiraceae bacterium]MCI9572332.1 type II toxin-antitoxin system VapC family toxin [Lachnospiraceae bacterium]